MTKTHTPTIEIIARGLWIHQGKVLLCQNVKYGHQFLPGGHVDFGEQAAVALQRELVEELGVQVTVGKFLGVCEARFEQGKKTGHPQLHHEVSFVFEITPSDESTDPFALVSKEDHIRFVWSPVQDVMDWQTPGVLPGAIRGIVRAADRHGSPEWVTDWE